MNTDLKHEGKFETNESFYNSIATKYESHLTKEDVAARAEVAKVFIQNVKSGAILDFGGGTGLDLPWLLAQEKYRVIFLEPSSNMREVAKSKYENQKEVTFLENNLNF